MGKVGSGRAERVSRAVLSVLLASTSLLTSCAQHSPQANPSERYGQVLGSTTMTIASAGRHWRLEFRSEGGDGKRPLCWIVAFGDLRDGRIAASTDLGPGYPGTFSVEETRHGLGGGIVVTMRGARCLGPLYGAETRWLWHPVRPLRPAGWVTVTSPARSKS